MLEEYKKRPQDFTRQIVASGKTEDIRKLETKILMSADAATNESFYNMHNGFDSYLTEEICKNIGIKSKERWNNLSEDKKLAWIDMIKVVNRRPKTENEKAAMRGKRPHVNQSGSKNNNARAIKTPFGTFGSIKECSKTVGIKYDNIYYKLRAKHKDWEYV